MNTETNKEIGSRIKKFYIGRFGYLAKLIDKTSSTITTIVSGERPLRPQELEIIASDMEITIGELVSGAEPPTIQENQVDFILGTSHTQYITKVTQMMTDMDEDMQKDICLSVEKEKLLRDLLRQKDSDEKAG